MPSNNFPIGVNEDVVKRISTIKDEPNWMLNIRLSALKVFEKKNMPTWGADLSEIDFNKLKCYIPTSEKQKNDWNDVPSTVKKTFDAIGIPQAEKEALSGVKAQYDSEVIYGSLLEKLEKSGVIFMSMDEALKKHPEVVKKYFGTIIPASDNKFAALNTAVWSGGSFLYIPKRVKLEKPLQAYFRINATRMGQFERTLIIADEGAYGHYVEGCSAPMYSGSSLHSGVVEVIVKRNAHIKCTTVQNWYKSVYNMVTKRAFVYKNGTMQWVDGNIGSKVTMKYPSVYMFEEGAKGEMMSIVIAKDGQHQDTGSKMVHLAPNTSSKVISKSISKGKGRASYRGLVKVIKRSEGVKSKVVCDALLLNSNSRADTYPVMQIDNKKVQIEHEASVSKVGQDQLQYLKSRGLSESEASSLIVNGFINPIICEIPMEFALELNRLIELEMEGSLG